MSETVPFTVNDVILASLEALFAAAALHVGETLPDGTRLASPDEQEAWKALLAASGMVAHVRSVMASEAKDVVEPRLKALLTAFAARYPNAALPAPASLAEALGLG